MKQIPYSSIDLKKEDYKKIEKIIKSGWLAHGKASVGLRKPFVNLHNLNLQLLFQAALWFCT